MNIKHVSLSIVALAFITTSLNAYDVLVEGKGNCFISTNDSFQDIYGKAVGGGGFEITAGEYKNIYGFMSIDAFHKKGSTPCFCSETTATFVEIALGLKYFVPFNYGDFYIGLGVLPTYLKTKDCSPFVVPTLSKWGCGGIAKVGVYFALPKSFIVDIFVNYSFVNINYDCCFNGCTQTHPAKLNGVIVGAGLGYRFN
jgi:hypothetical protein